MSEFDPPINSKSSECSNGSVEKKADFQEIRDLSQQINLSNAEKTSTDRSMQQSSIRNLLAYDSDRHDQSAKSLTQDLTPLAGVPPGTFAPQKSLLEEVLTPPPSVNTVRQAAEDLELLVQMICDFLSPHLNLEMERRGFHQSNRIFSHQTIATHQIDPAQSALSSSTEVLERLIQEIEQELHQRLVYERERQGRLAGCLPW